MKSIRPIRYTLLAPTAALAGAVLLAACSQQTGAPEPTPPPPPPPVATTPPPPPPPPPPVYADWRDAPATEGQWYSVRQGDENHNAEFRTPEGEVLLEVRCRSRTIEMRRAGTGTEELPMTFRTTHGDETRTANPVRPLKYEARIFYDEDLLDKIAYSRGRFALEVNGLPTLYLPSRPELIRTFQECRD